MGWIRAKGHSLEYGETFHELIAVPPLHDGSRHQRRKQSNPHNFAKKNKSSSIDQAQRGTNRTAVMKISTFAIVMIAFVAHAATATDSSVVAANPAMERLLRTVDDMNAKGGKCDLPFQWLAIAIIVVVPCYSCSFIF